MVQQTANLFANFLPKIRLLIFGGIIVPNGNSKDMEWKFDVYSYIEDIAEANDVEIRVCSFNIYNSFYLSMLIGYYFLRGLL
jgi:hypothetical protein